MDSASPSAVGLVGLAGTVSQAGGVALLVVLFVSLRDHARRTSYFPQWKWAWVSALVGLAAVSLRYSPVPSMHGAFWSLPEADAQVRLLYLVHQTGKLLFLALIVTGTHTFARGLAGVPSTRFVAIVCLLLGTVSVSAASTLNAVLLLQVLIAVPAFAYSGWLLFSLPRARRSWGSMSLGVTLTGHSVLWLVYGFGFGYKVWVNPIDPRNPIHLLLTYNSFVDLFLGMLLGYTMVNVLMEDAARVIAAAHGELAAAHDQLRRLALFDSLTGALNRRAFGEGVGLERVRAGFGAVAMLDVDNLKPVNDAYGHAMGDALLRHLVGVLGMGLPATDKLYRWGGDEFLVLMPAATRNDAVERISSLLRDVPLLQEGSVAIPLRVSIGIASFSSAEELLTAVGWADRAMYEAKAQRREQDVAPHDLAEAS